MAQLEKKPPNLMTGIPNYPFMDLSIRQTNPHEAKPLNPSLYFKSYVLY